MPTQLPPKENTLFKRILKCYEQKQYKNGLKFCKQILSNPKFAEHGETLAMKGLTLNYLGRKDEAYDYVKRGLKNDLRSHVCWHVYGLLQRADHKYDEAIKCYRNALKWDKDNIQILRDLSLLQVQMRDTEGFRDTRYQLLKIRPAQRQSWIGYSISYYLLNNYDMAFTVMEEFRKTLFQDNQPKMDLEHSEMLFYQNMILREQGKDKEALEHLEKFENFMTDKLKVQEIKGTLYLSLGHVKDAEKLYRELVKRNPENRIYYEGIEKCQATESPNGTINDADKLALYLSYKKRYPRAETPRWLPFGLPGIEMETFKSLVDQYLRNALKKGVPPLFTNLRPIYHHSSKAAVIENLLLSYADNLMNLNKFSSEDSDEDTQDPTVLLWTNFYLAQHYDHFRKTKIALKYINRVLEHTPTLIEGYMVKAKIYKHAGCPQEAAKWMDEGRSLDTADRYVNSKCAKYLLRANEVKKAIEICGLFTKEGTLPDEDLDSMQCMWFGIECANAHKRLGEIGEALKKCHQIERNFNEIVEDQFDFHTYCMRKVTLCAYIKLLKLEDVLRSHSYYFKGAKTAIECYIGLHDKPYSASDDSTESNKGNLSAKELKKLKSKQRRAQKKQQQSEDEKKANEGKENKDAEGKKDEGKIRFDASELVKAEKPLDEAIKFLVPLQHLAKDRIETHLMGFEIYLRKEKPLLMLQSVKRAHACKADDPGLHSCIVRFLMKIKEGREGYSDTVKAVLDKEVSTLVKQRNIEKYNQQYIEAHPKSLKAQVTVARCMFSLGEKKEEAMKLLTTLTKDLKGIDLELCTEVFNSLSDYGATNVEIEAYRKRCSKFFPLSDLFKENEEMQSEEEVLMTKWEPATSSASESTNGITT